MKNKTKDPTPEELALAKANSFAKQWALRKHLISGEDTHVGDTVPQFVDQTGLPTPPQSNSMLPPRTITNINQIPPYVTNLDFDSESNVPYYTDEKTGDIQYVHPDIARSSRFNPNRGQTIIPQRLEENYVSNKIKTR